jgi:hypothetical protein
MGWVDNKETVWWQLWHNYLFNSNGMVSSKMSLILIFY